MNHTTRSTAFRRIASMAAAGAVVAATLAGCSSSPASSTSGSGSTSGPAAVTAALKKGGTITYWTWTPTAKAQVAAFEKAYPKVKVNLVNAGTSATEYTKLQNAIKAGTGAPDVAQIEYFALPQFTLGTPALVNLTQFGFNKLKSDYSSGPWSNVNLDGKLVALPQDSGPMALFYNKTEFAKYGLTVPKTWDQYIADAKKLHAANPKAYITSDTGDPGFITSMIWQAGGHPFTVNGTKVSINLQDAGTKKFTSTWDQLVEGKLVAPITSWTNDWYTALGNGDVASLVTGAWMPATLESSVPDGSGNWAVAPMPTYDGQPANAENGGSAQAVLTQSKNQALAAGFVKWLNNSEDSVNIFIKGGGGFPSTTADQNSSTFLDQAPAYFGGQKINQVLVDGAKNVVSGWQYLPFEVYANSIFPDTVGHSYTASSSLNPGLQAWQKQLIAYGNQQGFTVTAG